jgi:hypothetical protein
VLAVRWLGLFWVTAGLWMLVANVAESATEVDPSYPGFYLQATALRPGLAILLGVILWFLGGKIGRRLAKGVDRADHE